MRITIDLQDDLVQRLQQQAEARQDPTNWRTELNQPLLG